MPENTLTTQQYHTITVSYRYPLGARVGSSKETPLFPHIHGVIMAHHVSWNTCTMMPWLLYGVNWNDSLRLTWHTEAALIPLLISQEVPDA